MDIVDLDKVLDDFEEDEERISVENDVSANGYFLGAHNGTSNSYKISIDDKYSDIPYPQQVSNEPPTPESPLYNDLYPIPYKLTDGLKLSDADFGFSPRLNDLKEGSVEDLKDDISIEAFTNSEINSVSQLFQNNGVLEIRDLQSVSSQNALLLNSDSYTHNSVVSNISSLGSSISTDSESISSLALQEPGKNLETEVVNNSPISSNHEAAFTSTTYTDQKAVTSVLNSVVNESNQINISLAYSENGNVVKSESETIHESEKPLSNGTGFAEGFINGNIHVVKNEGDITDELKKSVTNGEAVDAVGFHNTSDNMTDEDVMAYLGESETISSERSENQSVSMICDDVPNGFKQNDLVSEANKTDSELSLNSVEQGLSEGNIHQREATGINVDTGIQGVPFQNKDRSKETMDNHEKCPNSEEPMDTCKDGSEIHDSSNTIPKELATDSDLKQYSNNSVLNTVPVSGLDNSLTQQTDLQTYDQECYNTQNESEMSDGTVQSTQPSLLQNQPGITNMDTANTQVLKPFTKQENEEIHCGETSIKDTVIDMGPSVTHLTSDNTYDVTVGQAELDNIENVVTSNTVTSTVDNSLATMESSSVSTATTNALFPAVKAKEPHKMKRPSSLLGLSTVTMPVVSNVAKSQSLPRSFSVGTVSNLGLTDCKPVVDLNSVGDVSDAFPASNSQAVDQSEVSSDIPKPGQHLNMLPEDASSNHSPTPEEIIPDVNASMQLAESRHGLPTVVIPHGQPQEVSHLPREARPESLNLPPFLGFPSHLPDGGVEPESFDGTRLYRQSSENSDPPSYMDLEDSGSDSHIGAVGGVPLNPGSAPGSVAPVWVPDAEAPNCMQCDSRFTFTKRRHHCRACGKVFCSTCCSLKSKLDYLGSKEARVCVACHEGISNNASSRSVAPSDRSPNPNNPSEYCSTIPPHQQVNANSPAPTVLVPVGVLKREGSHRRGEPKQVMFSDGIRPGGDLTEIDGVSEARLPIRSGRKIHKVERSSASGATIEDNPTDESLILILQKDSADPVVFMINLNLQCEVSIVNLDCCVHRKCWCFMSRGLCTVGQEEVVIVLEFLPEEKDIPMDIFHHYQALYEAASKGTTVTQMGHSIFTSTFLGNKDHGGFLYIRPSFQCLLKLNLPPPPFVVGILLQKWEIPWAKVFPIRLLLRLGAEYRYYPCPLISIRNRKPVFFEIGHTIMNLLADFRGYQYMLAQVRGVQIHMEDQKTLINFPKNRYHDLMKIVTGSNEHVMALGATFSLEADSHLVCIQNDDGNYQTQAINIQNKPRKVTGASFVVFNGALKSASGLTAKSSIVEDGLMVQISADSMTALKQSIKDMKNYSIACGSITSAKPDEIITIQWVEDDKSVNIGVRSPIDNMAMDGIESIHIHNGTDYQGENKVIRWTEVFFIQNKDSAKLEPIDLSRLAESLAQAGCIALTPHLDALKDAGLMKIGLRATIHAESVGYEVGSNGEKLPDRYMNDLDNELIPVIHNAASLNQEGPITLELIFFVLN